LSGLLDHVILAAAQAEGLNAALSQLDGITRKRYLRRLDQYTHEPVVLRRLSIGPGLKSLRFLSWRP